jgi:hypothetical protein
MRVPNWHNSLKRIKKNRRPSRGVILCDLVAGKKLNLGYGNKEKVGAGKAKSVGREGME